MPPWVDVPFRGHHRGEVGTLWRPPACSPRQVGCGAQLEPGWLPHGESRDASCSGSAGPGRVRAGCASQRVPSLLPGSWEALGSGVRSPLTARGQAGGRVKEGLPFQSYSRCCKTAQGTMDPRVLPPSTAVGRVLALLGVGDLGVQVKPHTQS